MPGESARPPATLSLPAGGDTPAAEASLPADAVASPAPVISLPTPAWMRRLWEQLGRSLRAHSLFVVIVLAYVGIARLIAQLAGLPVAFALGPDIEFLYVLTAAFLWVVSCAYIGYVMVAVRPRRLMRYLKAVLLDRVLTVERIAVVLPALLLLPLFMSAFTYLKTAIPYLQPFDLDPLLAEWDQALHGGYQPWELLQPILGHRYVSAAINFVYHLWLFVMFGVLLWQSVSLSRPRLRMQFMITFVLLWPLLGNVAATLLSSAGPVYYGRVTGLPDPFVPLMAYLREASQFVWLPALDVQEMLWTGYVNGGIQFGGGISAMPSLHLATSFSFALLGFAINRRLGLLFALFTGLILVGSVHLGWHYALDGYAGILATWPIWWAVGWFLDRPRVSWMLWGEAGPRRAAA